MVLAVVFLAWSYDTLRDCGDYRAAGALQQRGIITRPVKPYGLPEWLRITVGTHAQNERLLATLAEVLRAYYEDVLAKAPAWPHEAAPKPRAVAVTA